jgi:hypothetical protein
MGSALVKGLLESGAPWGLLCAALAVAVGVLWKRITKLTDEVIQLAKSQVEVNAETRATLRETKRDIERDLEDISRRIELQ